MRCTRNQDMPLRGLYCHSEGLFGVGWYVGIPEGVSGDSRGCFEARLS